MNKMRPIHPGEILAEELEARSINAAALAAALGVVHNRISQILAGKRALPPIQHCVWGVTLALRLSSG
jgi:plasmid maintenance system antidote protein VapI